MHLPGFLRSIFLITILASMGFASLGYAQTDQQDQIQTRLDEVKKMIDEERNSVNDLEGQLKSALDDRDADRIEKLRQEIETGYDSLESLEDLKKQLRDLQESAEKDSRSGLQKGAPARIPRGRRKVPTPTLGGTEGRVDWEAERKRREDKRDTDDARDRAGRRNSGPAVGGRSSSRNESAKLRQLRDALDALVDAGLDDMADEIRTQIKAEEDKLKRRKRPRRGDRDRGDDRGKDIEGPTMVDGPASADGSDRRSSGRRKPRSTRGKSGSRSNERSRDRKDTSEFDDEIQDLEDKIDQLREKLRDLKDDDDG